MSSSSVILRDGHRMPAIGLGTYPLRGAEAVRAICTGIGMGYRLIDTAVHYDNETDVGEAIRLSGVPRQELFVVSKLPGRHQGRREAFTSTKASLDRLGLSYLDMHLIHWPNPKVGRFVEAWQALIDLQAEGLVRSIGVSNFTIEHLEQIIDATGVVPALNQIEMHPLFPQKDLRQVHDKLGITTVAWSPLGRGTGPLNAPAVQAAAQRCGVTPAQVILRWHVELGAVPVPKSANPERQRQNLNLFGFELTAAEIESIAALERVDGRTGGIPDQHIEM